MGEYLRDRAAGTLLASLVLSQAGGAELCVQRGITLGSVVWGVGVFLVIDPGPLISGKPSTASSQGCHLSSGM